MITITDKRQTQCFGDLEAGETFLARSHGVDILYIKLYFCEGDNNGAVCLENGVIVEFCYNDEVTPVEVEANIIR